MATIVIGGHTRNIGKTSVVCALISALPELHWTAIKITQCPANGEPCDCETADHATTISEEYHASAGTDSSRYLAAGAVRSFWVRTRWDRLAEAMPRIRAEIGRAENVVVESNSVLAFITPDIYATVLDPAIADFKHSALRYLERADVVLMLAHLQSAQGWPDVPWKLMDRMSRFEIAPPDYSSHQFARYVADKIAGIVAAR